MRLDAPGHGGEPGAFATLLPRGAVTVGSARPGTVADLLPAERRGTERMLPHRLAEFAAGRRCAHEALRALTPGRPVVPRDGGGRPVWPPGVLGSLTHCTGLTVAAVAPRRVLRAVGIDAELHDVPRPVVLRVASAAERVSLRALTREEPHLPWGAVLFSAKESVLKAVSAATGGRYELAALPVAIRVDGTFDVLHGDGPPTGPARLRGRWRVHGPWVLTAAYATGREPRPDHPGAPSARGGAPRATEPT